MLDFPALPVDGEEYTAEGATWAWSEATGAWAYAVGPDYPPVTEFIDPTRGNSWRIIGDVLEQWGYVGSSEGYTKTMTKTYASATEYSGIVNCVTGNRVARLSKTNASQFNTVMRNTSGNTASAETYWYCIGKWDGVS